MADVGCGEGWSAISIALGYPACEIDGYDIDEPSITAAKAQCLQPARGRACVIRRGRRRPSNGYARSAGFDGATPLGIEHDFFRFYLLQGIKQVPNDCDRGATRRGQVKRAADSALLLEVGST